MPATDPTWSICTASDVTAPRTRRAPGRSSQIALPKEACDTDYATTGYEKSMRNLGQTSLSSDNAFGNDGGIHQIATMSGDTASGYTAALTISI